MTDTKRRMPDSQLLIGGTSWLSDGEGQCEDVAYHLYSTGSMVNEGCPLTCQRDNALDVLQTKIGKMECSAKTVSELIA